jgi:transcription antitermination factor NusG
VVCLAVKPGCEKAVARLLRRRKLEEYLPIYSGRRRLFPGFVFCRFNHQNRRAVIEIPGVFSIVDPHESASPISDAEIARIKMILASRLPVKPRTLLCPGQRVGMRRGPLVGLESGNATIFKLSWDWKP